MLWAIIALALEELNRTPHICLSKEYPFSSTVWLYEAFENYKGILASRNSMITQWLKATINTFAKHSNEIWCQTQDITR